MQNLHQLFDWQYIGQVIGGYFAKFCGRLLIYELYNLYCQCSKVIRSNSRVQNYRCLCGCKKEDCNIGGSTELKLMARLTKLGLLGYTVVI